MTAGPELLESLAVGPFEANCFLLACPETREAVLIDPGNEPERILAAVRSHKVALKTLLLTHAHLDHVSAARGVKEALGDGVEIRLHPEDRELYDMLPERAAEFGLTADKPLPVDRELRDGETVRFGNCELRVIHTPGHSPGSVCFLSEGPDKLLFSGDTLFAGGIGATHFWRGDHALLIRSIRERLLTLDPDTKVACGHGPETTIGREKVSNPFLA